MTPSPRGRRAVVRWCTGVALLAVALLPGACTPAVTPLPESRPAPVVAPETPPPAVAPRRFSIDRTLPSAQYAVRVVSALRADSQGAPLEEEVRAEGTVTVRGTRARSATSPTLDALRAEGRVDGFRLTASARVRDARGSALPGTTPPALPDAPIVTAFEAVFDSVLARVAPVPPLANECDQPSVAAAALAREVLLRLPEAITPGLAWQDSVRVFTCRGGVPITLHLVSETRVTEIARDGRRATLERSVRSTAEGELALGWRTVGLRGRGDARYTVTLDLPEGTVNRVDGTGEMRFEASDSARPSARDTRVLQRTTYEARRITP